MASELTVLLNTIDETEREYHQTDQSKSIILLELEKSITANEPIMKQFERTQYYISCIISMESLAICFSVSILLRIYLFKGAFNHLGKYWTRFLDGLIYQELNSRAMIKQHNILFCIASVGSFRKN